MANPSIWSQLPVELLYFIIRDTDDSSTLQSWTGINRRFSDVANAILWEDIRISEHSLLRTTDYLPVASPPEVPGQNLNATMQESTDGVTDQVNDEDSDSGAECNQNTGNDNDNTNDDTNDNTEGNSEYGDDDKAQTESADGHTQEVSHSEDEEYSSNMLNDEEDGRSFQRGRWSDESRSEEDANSWRRASEDSRSDAPIGVDHDSGNERASSCLEDDVYIIGGVPCSKKGLSEKQVEEDGAGMVELVKLPNKGHCLLKVLHQQMGPMTPSLLPSIKHLTLDFQFSTLPLREVASEDVAVSVHTVLRHANKIEAILHNGVLYQEILELIASLSRPKMLDIREGCTVSNCVHKDETSETGYSGRPLSDFQLDFRPIGQMRSLRVLRISGLLPNEGCNLAKAIGGLNSLEELNISVALHSSPAMWPFAGDGVLSMSSPLDDFLITMFGPFLGVGQEVDVPVNGIGFPATLKNLSLVDRDFQYTRLTFDYIESRFRTIPSLTKLYINCLSINKGESIYLAQVLRSLMTHQVSHLTIPICEGLKYSNPDKIFQQDDLIIVLLAYKKTVDTWVFRANPDSELIDLPFRQKLELLWNNKNVFRQLHTAVEPTEWYRETLHLRDHYLSTYLTGLDSALRGMGCSPPYIASWIPGLRHLRLESVDMDKLKVDPVDDVRFGLKGLKVFISPSSRTSFTSYGRILPRAVPRHFSKLQFPQRADDFTEGRLASELVRQDLPCLRIIIFGEYQFWVERFPNNEAGPQLWYMHTAVADHEQRRKMSECLDEKDWEFLQNPPDFRLAEMENTTLPERLVVHRLNQEGPTTEGELLRQIEALKI